MDHAVAEELQGYSGFELRRVLERLREGLSDPLAARLLTARRAELDARLQQDLGRVAADDGVHLCVCGAYGQGKSHTLAYLQESALQQGYAVSAMHLDPRETPLHQFRLVYRTLLQALHLPSGRTDSTAGLLFADAWTAWARSQSLAPGDAAAALLPAGVPDVFKAILTALVRPTLEMPSRRRHSAPRHDFRPADVPSTLQRALHGEAVPVFRLRAALQYRQVPCERQISLSMPGDEPFLQMISVLPQLLRRMGYRGWMLLFDEAEAIAQVRRPQRARSYRILHRLLCPEASQPGLYPVFAFTPDFFQRLQEEDYSLPDFDRDYAHAWRHLSLYQLRGLSLTSWQSLCTTLIALHAAAYGWPADHDYLLPLLTARLSSLPLQDTRSTFKALVDELDQVHQQAWFARRLGDRA